MIFIIGRLYDPYSNDFLRTIFCLDCCQSRTLHTLHYLFIYQFPLVEVLLSLPLTFKSFCGSIICWAVLLFFSFLDFVVLLISFLLFPYEDKLNYSSFWGRYIPWNFPAVSLEWLYQVLLFRFLVLKRSFFSGFFG